MTNEEHQRHLDDFARMASDFRRATLFARFIDIIIFVVLALGAVACVAVWFLWPLR